MTEIESIERLGEIVGREVAVSEWLEVSQGRIDGFAEATEDGSGFTPTRSARRTSRHSGRPSRTAS